MNDATLIRISTQGASYLYEAKTEAAALDKFAATVGYDNYAGLASTLGKSVDEAKADLVIARGTYPQVLAEIIDEAIGSDALLDGANEPFESAKAWADCCMKGRVGDEATSFARDHNLPVNTVWYAVEDALLKRSIDDTNAPWAEDCGEGSSMLFADLAGKEPLASDATLPDQFFHRIGDAVYRYTYTGPQSYEVFERRGEGDRVIWIGYGSTHVSDDTTAEDMEAYLG